MPSFKRSRNDRCRLGPEPVTQCGDCKCVPEEGRLGEDVAEFSPLLLQPPPRPVCTGDGLLTTLRIGLPIDPPLDGGVAMVTLSVRLSQANWPSRSNKVYQMRIMIIERCYCNWFYWLSFTASIQLLPPSPPPPPPLLSFQQFCTLLAPMWHAALIDRSNGQQISVLAKLGNLADPKNIGLWEH